MPRSLPAAHRHGRLAPCRTVTGLGCGGRLTHLQRAKSLTDEEGRLPSPCEGVRLSVLVSRGRRVSSDHGESLCQRRVLGRRGAVFKRLYGRAERAEPARACRDMCVAGSQELRPRLCRPRRRCVPGETRSGAAKCAGCVLLALCPWLLPPCRVPHVSGCERRASCVVQRATFCAHGCRERAPLGRLHATQAPGAPLSTDARHVQMATCRTRSWKQSILRFCEAPALRAASDEPRSTRSGQLSCRVATLRQ
jgi:hypothetical protein